MSPADTIHATCVAIAGQGVIIMGESGSGKSDLALRLINRGAALVSDDRTVVTIAGDASPVASPPPRIAGKIEIRNIGIVEMPYLDRANIVLVVSLEPCPPRMPDDGDRELICGIGLPCLRLDAKESSAPVKVEMALRALSA